jgi:hypothetical protein
MAEQYVVSKPEVAALRLRSILPKVGGIRDMASRKNEHVDGVQVPAALREAIETERDNLGNAVALLGCLAISLEHAPDSPEGPSFPSVVQVALELVARSIDALDSFNLQKRLKP